MVVTWFCNRVFTKSIGYTVAAPAAEINALDFVFPAF